MALTKPMKKSVLEVSHGDCPDWKVAVVVLATAVLDLDAAVHELEKKMERAEHLAGHG